MKIAKSVFILVFGIFFAMLIISNFPSISAENENIGIRGNAVTIRAILLQNGTYGVPVSDQVIEFYDQTINNFLNYGITDDFGIASITWIIPDSYPLGPTIINATFRGNESLFLAPSCQWVSINILSSTSLTINNDEDVLAPGDNVSFEIQILDDHLNPIPYASVSAYCNNMLIAVSITNDSGIASFSIHCNTSWSNYGENIIHVVFEQDLINYYSRAEAMFTIHVQKLNTQINIASFSNHRILGDELSADINLNSTEGGIPGNLSIFLDGYQLGIISTDGSGHFTFITEIDNRFSLGSHNLQIKYNGSDRYSESVLNKQFGVFSYTDIEFRSNTTAIINSTIDFKVQVTDMLNRPVSGILYISDSTSGFNTSCQIPMDSSDFIVPFTMSGSTGYHNISLAVDNSYVLNGTLSYSLIVWSLIKIEISETNVYHYSSPNQEILFLVHLRDYFGNCSDRDIQLLLNGNIIQNYHTNEDGIATLMTNAPLNEGTYNYSILYPKNFNRFELLTRLDYQLTVCKQMPVKMNLNDFEIIPPLQIIKVKLQVVCLNGSLLQGITAKFDWFSIEKLEKTKENGIIILQLPLSSTSGNFSLHYEIQSTSSLSYSSGYITLSITYVSILATQGIGISGFVITFIASSILFAIPIIRHRFFI